MSELRVLVADDEAPARRVLSRLLCEHEDVRVAAECADGLAAVEGISKEHPQLVVKAGVVSGSQMLDADGVKALSAMPSLPEMRARLLGLMQAPAARLVRLLNTPAGQLARVLKAHQEKEEGAAAPS